MKESKFYYYWYQQPTQPIEYTVFDVIQRANESYRFVFDNLLTPTTFGSYGQLPTYKISVPAGKEIMIGNPFVSQLDFEKFYEINQSQLATATYRLYVNNNWGAQYTAGSGSGTLTKHIAPLQAFVIETSASATELLFPPDLVSVIKPDNKLRSAGNSQFSDNVLYVEASNAEGGSWVTLGKKQGINSHQLFSEDKLYANVPQIYIADGNDKNAVHFIPEEESNEVAMGIRSKSDGKIALRFKNPERFNVESLILKDKITGATYNLFQRDEVQFDNIPDISDRFVLLIGKQKGPSSTEIVQDVYVQMYTKKKTLFVESGEIIQQIAVTNIQGVNIFNWSSINSKDFSTDMNIPSGVYIVNVMLTTGESVVGKVIVN